MGAHSSSFRPAQARLAAVTAHAVTTTTDVMRAAGRGRHQITTAAQPENADPVVAQAGFEVIGEGEDALWSGSKAEAAQVAEVMTLAFILARGSVVLGTTSPTGEESVRAWMITGHTLTPLTTDEARHVFRETGGRDSTPVAYRTAFAVPASAAA
ncbi:hypothetical protein DMH25_46205 [Streptomyces sp. WAC 01325]|nr:hypothetical protein DMH25_46205 [Streptomyces sp. WAC 01325]